MMARPERIRLGDVLVAQKVISQAQLADALERQRESGRKLGRVLVENGYASEEQISLAIAHQMNIPYVDLRRIQVKSDVVRLLPEQSARRFRAVVLENRDSSVLVAMADPTDLFAYDEIVRILKKTVDLAVTTESAVAQFIDTVYRRTDEISELARSLSEELGGEAIDISQLASSGAAEDAPVVRLLQSIFEDALQIGASDIHIEPTDSRLQIRVRVDGVLHVSTEADRRIGPALIQRLKLMGEMDIAEKRLPQDGRFVVRVQQKQVDVRLSVIPTQYGESAVMRLLAGGGEVALEGTGIPADTLERFRRLIRKPNGLVLVTGPTGSGKTTTLYGALSELNSPEVKILTVEDPVEYRLPGVSQVQVVDKIDLTFARALRAFLRQDPDIILVGEMRDQETALIALRAALTGHLVLSTLHTNDAAAAAARLMDMGAPPYLLASALIGIMAQRLVRKLCPMCAEVTPLTPAERAWLKPELDRGLDAGALKRGRGCPHCNFTGYKGRQGVFELLEIDATLAGLLNAGNTKLFYEAARRKLAGRTLHDEAVRLAAQGVTSVAEAMRAAHQSED
ncbi:MAG: GspE/PulE family protein [Pseudomonadota bacterium]